MAHDRYDGPLPTIASVRRNGVTRFHVHCHTPNCWHQKRFTFDELGLSDNLAFIHIPLARHFVCSVCGGRDVSVRSDIGQYYRDIQRRTGYGLFLGPEKEDD